MEFRQKTGVGAVSVPNIVTCSSPWGQPGDPVKAIDCSSTARSWGWNRSTTSRRVKAWGASGELGRTPGSDGRSVFTARTPDVPQVCATAAALASPSANSLLIPTVNLPVQSAAKGQHPVIGIVQHFGGWRLPSEGLGRCPRRASSGFHPKRQTPFRVKEEREDGVAFSAPEKPPDACTPAARREGRVAAQCCATTRKQKAMSIDVDERISRQIANEFESGVRLKPWNAAYQRSGSRISCAGPAGRPSRG
jgi:hypothetical protein